MHGFALGTAGFVDDAFEEAANGGVGERAGIDALGVLEDFALTLGLIERKIFGLLDFADFEGAAGTLVEQLDEFAVDFIDLAAPVGESHGSSQETSESCKREGPRQESDAAQRRRKSKSLRRPVR